jgi:hypothetical protein
MLAAHGEVRHVKPEDDVFYDAKPPQVSIFSAALTL